MFVVTQKVKISSEFSWAKSEFGVISYPPESFKIFGYDRVGYIRTVPGVKGPIRLYYVKFEKPQIDADGDGPYRGAEIPEKYLIPIKVE